MTLLRYYFYIKYKIWTIQIPSLIKTILKMLQVPEEMRPSWTLYLGMSSFKQKYPIQVFPMA